MKHLFCKRARLGCLCSTSTVRHQWMNHLKEGRTFLGGMGFQRRDKLANSTLRSVFMKQLIQHVTTTYNFITFWAHKENEDVLVHASPTFNLKQEVGRTVRFFNKKILQQKDISEQKQVCLSIRCRGRHELLVCGSGWVWLRDWLYWMQQLLRWLLESLKRRRIFGRYFSK